MARTQSGRRSARRNRRERYRGHVVVDERLRDVERGLITVVAVPVVTAGREDLSGAAVRYPHVEANTISGLVQRSRYELLDA